jgi:hypothetical protein
MLFNSELALVNRELNKKLPCLEPYMAQYSGQAHYVLILRRRIDRVMNVGTCLPDTVLSETALYVACWLCVAGRHGELAQRVFMARG